jgi:hypothetical protein
MQNHPTMETEQRTCACCSGSRLKWSGWLVAILGLGLIALAAFLPPFINSKLDDGINSAIILTPDAQAQATDAYRTFVNFTDDQASPVFFNVYMFNVTNPNEVLAGAAPNVTEVGPFVFREIKIRSNVTFGQDMQGHDTMSYLEWEYYLFQPDMSNGLTLDMPITTAHLPFQAVINQGSLASNFIAYFLDVVLPQHNVTFTPYQRMWDTRSVSDLVFGPYFDPMLYWLNQTLVAYHLPGISPYAPGLNQNETELPPDVGFDTIYTGSGDNMHNIRSYLQYHGSYVAAGPAGPSPWGTEFGPQANLVFGTDGSQFARNPPAGGNLTVYVSEVFRKVLLGNLDGETVDQSGITCQRYRIHPSQLLNATLNPFNADYYLNKWNGALNMSATFQGIPIFVTKPHMLDAEPAISSSVNGLSPNRDLHDTVIDVEPTSGAVLHAAKRLEINVQIGPVDWNVVSPGICFSYGCPTWFANMSSSFLPVMWVEETGSVTDSQASDFRHSVYVAQAASYYTAIIGYIVGNVVITLAVLLLTCAYTRKVDYTPESASWDPHAQFPGAAHSPLLTQQHQQRR